ncbi:MAG TPA: hypothetical protein EYP41_18210 [Anaerolineae bacterium]|nr:hypothetical protein [Anaerolineae bacterium]HIP69877.1 hypothetical protein [Anaerolineae bacterium]
MTLYDAYLQGEEPEDDAWALDWSEWAGIYKILKMTKDDLFRQALASFLTEQKREILQRRLNILTRYAVTSIADLEDRIAQGEVAEHPAWEDLIVAENLAAHLEELDAYLKNLRDT